MPRSIPTERLPGYMELMRRDALEYSHPRIDSHASPDLKLIVAAASIRINTVCTVCDQSYREPF